MLFTIPVLDNRLRYITKKDADEINASLINYQTLLPITINSINNKNSLLSLHDFKCTAKVITNN